MEPEEIPNIVDILGNANVYSTVFVFLVGTLIGSFLNVCIYRLPLGRSIVLPPSACTHCGVPLQWYMNIPIVSYAVLWGSCGYCQMPYSPRYVFVEALTGGLLASMWWHFGGPTPFFWLYAFFTCVLIVIFYVDLDYWIILDSTSLGALVVGLIASVFLPGRAAIHFPSLDAPMLLGSLDTSHLPDWATQLLSAGIGALVGWLFFLAIAVVGGFLARQEAMGGGDVKLAAAIGAFLGWEQAMMSFLIAFWLGGLVAIPMFLFRGQKRREPIPFGTFMAIGAVIVVLYGQHLFNLLTSSLYPTF